LNLGVASYLLVMLLLHIPANKLTLWQNISCRKKNITKKSHSKKNNVEFKEEYVFEFFSDIYEWN